MFRLFCRTMSVGERILERMRILGLDRSHVIKATGASKGTLSQWISNTAVPSARYINPLCDVLQCSSDYLIDGRPDDVSGDNVSSVRYARGLVPLISKVQAGNWKQEHDEFAPGDAEEYLPCPRSHSRHTYALRVEGDSMTAPAGRSFPHGVIVYCDPEQVSGVVSGDPVIAKIDGEDEVTFKTFVKDGSRKFLKPLNPAYPVITDEFKILAKVIGYWSDS